MFTATSRGTYRCVECGSSRWETGRGLVYFAGEWEFLSILEESKEETSPVCEELGGGTHGHRWCLSSWTWKAWVLPVEGPKVCGFRVPNAYVRACNESGSLREFVRGEREAGRLTREEFDRAVELDRYEDDTAADRALRERVATWMRTRAPESNLIRFDTTHAPPPR